MLVWFVVLIVAISAIRLVLAWLQQPAKKQPAPRASPRAASPPAISEPLLPSAVGTEELKYQYEFSFVPSGVAPVPLESVALETEEQYILLSQNGKQIGYIPDPHKAKIVADAPDAEALVEPLRAYLGEKIPLIGHNIEFDMQFLCCAGLLSSVQPRSYFDTLRAAKSTYKLYAYRLDDLVKTVLHIDREPAHDALSDALAAGYLFKDMVIRKNESAKEPKFGEL